MCRLLGYVCDQPTSVNALMGGEAMDQWTALSRVHADGWGMAWHDGESLRSRSAPTCAATDSEYAALTARALGSIGLVHLRWATDGLAVDGANTHPFVTGDVALAHNGSISPVADLDRLLGPAGLSEMKGQTDSERYLGLVSRAYAETGDLVDAIASSVELLLGSFSTASLNAIIIRDDQLVAVHASSTASVPLSDLEELFPGLVGAPVDHVDSYFQMRYLERPGAVLVTSSGLGGGDWVDVPRNAMLVVDRATRRVTQVGLHAPDHEGTLIVPPGTAIL